MSRPCLTPGPTSLEGLAWLGRVGYSPSEPLQLVLGCSARRTRDHVKRLEAAGFLRRVPMTYGDGTLLAITRAGAERVSLPAGRAVRSLAPTNWAHASACAWTSAWLHLRRPVWWGEREIAEDAGWEAEVRYKDHRGPVRVGHYPDLAVAIAAGPVAIEVELQPKIQPRLVGILRMYADLTGDADPPLAGVIYVTPNDQIAGGIRRAAEKADLDAPKLSFRSLADIVTQARDAAAARAGQPATENENGAAT